MRSLLKYSSKLEIISLVAGIFAIKLRSLEKHWTL